MAQITQDMLLQALSDVSGMVAGLNQIADRFGQLDKTVQESGKGFSVVNQAVGTFLGTLATQAVGGIGKAMDILKGKFGEFFEFAKGATMQSAKLEVKWRTLSLTAGNAGKSIEEVSEYVKALQVAGIKTGEALGSVTNFLATGLPVEGIKDLARRAQDMAVVIGEDSTEAFNRFNLFLQTGNSEWIRTMGITKTATQMLEEYASSQGKTVKALTEREKKEALVHGLMQATVGYTGAYEEALKDPYKRWTSLPRIISNATEAIGAVFVPAMGAVVDIASDAIDRVENLFRTTKKGAYRMMAAELGKAVEDLSAEEKATAIDKFFGKWTEGFYKLRATISVFADWITGLWEGLVGEGEGWGEGLMDNIVDGIIAGTHALANVLVKVTGLIADFLAPGSAPKTGPLSTIDQWGTDLMKTYMEGWTKIDFSTFQQVAGTVQSAIQAAFTAAGGGKEQQIPLMERMLEGRRLAAQAVGDGAGVTGRLQEMAGPLGGDLAKYLDLVKQFKAATQGIQGAQENLARAEAWVAEASNQVAVAQERVAKTQEWVEEASKKVESVRRRVAKLESRWAEIPERFTRGRKRQLQAEIEAAEEEERRRQEALDQQQEVVEAAKKEEESRRAAIEAARAQVKAAEDHARAIQESMELQKMQIAELQKTMELEAKLAAERKKAAEAQEAQIAPVEKIKNDLETIDEQMQKYKEEIQARLQPAFDKLSESFANIKDIGGGLWETLKNLPSLASEWWEKLEPVRAAFAWLWDIIQKIAAKIGEAIEVYKQITAIAEVAMPGGGKGPIMMAGEEESLAEKFGNWLQKLRGQQPEAEQAADDALAKPFINAAERAHREVVGASILPDMVESVLGWFQRMAEDVAPPLQLFSDTAVSKFRYVADEWRLDISSLTEGLDGMVGRFNLLSQAILGLPTIPEELTLAAKGKFQVITVNLQGSQFGSNVNESDIRDWMFDAVGEAVA